MSLVQIILVALIPAAVIAWRVRRLLNVFRSGRSVWYKVAVGLVIVVGLVGRISRAVRASDADDAAVAQTPDTTATQADSSEAKLADSAPATPAAAPSAPRPVVSAVTLITQGEQALVRCDTATANVAFRQLAQIGIDLMNADTLSGPPLFFQAVALAGLRDSANAKVLATEALRLDRLRHLPESARRAALLRRIITLSGKRC